VLGEGGQVVAGRRPGRRRDAALGGRGRVAIGTPCRVEEVASLPGGGGCVAAWSGGWVAAGTPRRVGEVTSLPGGGCCIVARSGA
jgi:hypothetical protein